ncbi:unnamed protein product [Cuscuta epithymum]|uniref:Uncharacterized protein n=1 Tax=Cuscuta epithymum TaxID=186058 RepID=A0AAV0CDQ1_9ASTE|nr:unnamed protein product [Cuscuta epithymum]
MPNVLLLGHLSGILSGFASRCRLVLLASASCPLATASCCSPSPHVCSSPFLVARCYYIHDLPAHCRIFIIRVFAIVVAFFSTGTDSKCFQIQFSKDSEIEEVGKDHVPYGFGFIHFFFSTGAMYFPMQIIRWNIILNECI